MFQNNKYRNVCKCVRNICSIHIQDNVKTFHLLQINDFKLINTFKDDKSYNNHDIDDVPIHGT